MSKSILYGLLAGFLSISFISVIYLNNSQNILSGLEKFSWLIILVGMMFGTWRERQSRSEPFIAFAEAMQLSYKIFVIAYLMKFTAIYLLFNFIDPQLLIEAKETAVRIFIEHKNPDIPQEIFEKQLEAYKNSYFGPKIFDIGVMLELIVGFLLALFTAFLFKREKPEF